MEKIGKKCSVRPNAVSFFKMTWNLIKVNHNSSVLAVIIIIINMAMYLRVFQSTSSRNLMP